MSTKSREVIFGSQIARAKIRAEAARKRAAEAAREADRAKAEAWSIRMEGYGGRSLEHVRRVRDTPIWKPEAALDTKRAGRRDIYRRCT
jgi:hypothetical protein